jgi:hypothetical protein
MALSLDAIFKPLNEFFLKLFKTGAGSPVMFRFDKFGSVISEQDFIDPNHPELGYSPNRATERFSDLVNHIPSDNGDGMSIVFRQDAIDDAYFFRMLSPAQPCVSGNDPHNESIIDSFSAIKADAVKVWQNLKLESSSGLMLQYKPSLAGPESWYNKASADVWTHQSFSITAPETPVSSSSPKLQLWKLKLDDAALTHVFQSDRVQLSDQVICTLIKRPDPPKPDLAVGHLPAAESLSVQPERVSSPLLRARRGGLSSSTSMAISTATEARSPEAASIISKAAVRMDPAVARPTLALHDNVRMQMAELDVSQRYQIAQVIGS